MRQPAAVTPRPATMADEALILKRLSEIPNPPYQEDVQSLLDSPWEHIVVDGKSGEVCRVSLDEATKTATLVWLLPLKPKRFAQLRELARAAEKAAVKAHPEAAKWHYRAEFQVRDKAGALVVADKGLALCDRFQRRYYPGATVVAAVGEKPAEIFWTLGEAANG